MNIEIFNKRQHEKYVASLPEWDKYVIWMYTLGSAAINRDLLGFEPELEGYLRWVDKFLALHRTALTDLRIPEKYIPYRKYFADPKKIRSEPNALLICRVLGAMYADDLQNIIMNAPTTKGDITVFKASNPYNKLQVGKDVFQPSFNSSSYSADMDFSSFLPENPLCCMHQISIPEGSRVLFIPDSISAYPDECEVLLPRNTYFSVSSQTQVSIFITRNPDRFKKIQEWPYTLGAVYVYNKFSVLTGENRDLTMYISTLKYRS